MTKIKTKSSQTQTKAGPAAIFFTLFALGWNAVVIKLVILERDMPPWFQAVFVVAGLLVTWGAIFSWRQRLRGGAARLQLSQDPVPHGVPVAAEFQVTRHTQADVWQIEAKIESTTRNQSGFGLVWVQDYPGRSNDGYCVRAEITLPSDFPSTAASDKETLYRVTLTLKANGIAWAFDLQTRIASSSESRSMPLLGASKLGNLKPSLSPEELKATLKRWTWFVGAFAALALYLSASSLLDFSLWTYAQSLFSVAR